MLRAAELTQRPRSQAEEASKPGSPLHSPLQGPTSLVLTTASKVGRSSCTSVYWWGYQGSEQGCGGSSLQLLVAEQRFGPRPSDSCPCEAKVSSSPESGAGVSVRPEATQS